MRKIEDFSNDHRGVEAKKVVLEIRKINKKDNVMKSFLATPENCDVIALQYQDLAILVKGKAFEIGGEISNLKNASCNIIPIPLTISKRF